ncbi:MAG: SH3 domain-containing protein [Spirochaetia bacterium]|jgi:hypothetical protein|nr:SH3 domain-containing protein [Spirochaetia bacterium]
MDNTKYPALKGLSKVFAAVCLLLLFAGILASCESRIGWGLVLWSVKGTELKSGLVVPVYLKSNITKQYVIGLEDTDERFEVPLWQIEYQRSKKAAQKEAEALGELAPIYFIAERDGLPVRETPSNNANARRVYRMREGEMVKALAKVEGEAVYTGSEKLPGDWYLVITKDGTRGYVFSYALSIFDESIDEVPEQEDESAGEARTANAVFARTWRPAWYDSMLNKNEVDLDYFSLRFGLFGDALNRQIRIELPASSKVFRYSAIEQQGDWLVFVGSTLRIKVEGSTSILASWGPSLPSAEPDDAAGWSSVDSYLRLTYVESEAIRDAIRREEARRSAELREFFQAVGMAGGSPDAAGVLRFSSPFAGTIEFWPSGAYSWKGTLFLPAGFTPPSSESESEQKGSAAFGLRLSTELAVQWNGGFSLYPDTTGRRTDYAYALRGGSLLLAPLELPLPGSPSVQVKTKLGTTSLDIRLAQ